MSRINKMKKYLAIFVAFIMIFSFFPSGAAYAGGEGNGETIGSEGGGNAGDEGGGNAGNEGSGNAVDEGSGNAVDEGSGNAGNEGNGIDGDEGGEGTGQISNGDQNATTGAEGQGGGSGTGGTSGSTDSVPDAGSGNAPDAGPVYLGEVGAGGNQNPAPDQDTLVYISIPNTAITDTTNNTITFSINDKNVVVKVVGLADGEAYWNGDHELRVERNYLNSVKFEMGDNYDSSTMKFLVRGADNFNAELPYDSATRIASFNRINFPNGGVNLEMENQGGGGNNPPAGNNRAIINLTGPDGSWALAPKVEEDYDTKGGNGICSAPYNKYAYVASVSLNGCRYTDSVGHYTKDLVVNDYNKQEVQYNRGDSDTTVTLSIATSWSDKVEAIKVNGVDISVPFNYSDRNAWLSHFDDQRIVFDVTVPVSNRKENIAPESEPEIMVECYDIELKICPIKEEECHIGNFLWSNSDYFSPDGVAPNDMYIGNSSLILQSVDFSDGERDYHWNVNAVDDGTDRRYDYVDEDGRLLSFAHFQLNRGVDQIGADGPCASEMVIPVGSKVTMKIKPDYGYQVKKFTGVNFDDGSVALPGGECVYTFTVTEGNFHLGAVVEEEADDVAIETETVEDAGVSLADGTLDAGTARLSVSDADISAGKESEFEDVAAAEGLDIQEVLDISLDQVFFKGTGNKDDVWANPMEDLEEPAMIELMLDGDYTGKEVALIHNIHDGEEYEIIEPAEFDPDTGRVLFPADSFSSYAIAVKDVVEVVPADNGKKDTPAKEAEVKKAADDAKKTAKAKTGDEMNMMMIVIIMTTAFVGILTVYYLKKKEQRL